MARRLFLLVTIWALALTASPVGAQFALPESLIAPVTEAESALETEFAEADELETDRDSFTPATTVAARGRLIIESAWSFIDNRRVPDTNSLPELVTRYGLNDWLELRLGWNWEAGGAPNSISGGGSNPEAETASEIERDSQLLFGFKAALTSQQDWRPESAVILQGGTPTFGRETATSLVATYVVGWELANRWKWDTAMRYNYDSAEGDHFNIWAPSTVLKLPVGERWTAHAEYFGVMSQGREQDRSHHYFSPGVHCLLTSDLEIGIRVGWGLNDDAANFFANTGVGWRY